VQGWLSSVWGVSAVFGPTVGGSLAQYVSWRWIFVINLPLGAAAIALIARFLHQRVVRTRHRVDVAGAVLVLLAAGALIFGLLQGGVAWAWWSPPSIAVFAVAAAATVAAVTVESRAAEPIVPPWFWRRRALAGSGLAEIGLGLLVTGPSVFLPTYGQAVLGLGAVAAGAVLAMMSIGWPLASAASGRFFLRLGFRDTELIGAGVCLAAIVFFLLTMGYGQVWQPVVSTLVLGFGLGLISVCTLVGPQSTVTWEQRGVVTGTVMFCRFLGQSVGAAGRPGRRGAHPGRRARAGGGRLPAGRHHGRHPRRVPGAGAGRGGHPGGRAGARPPAVRHRARRHSQHRARWERREAALVAPAREFQLIAARWVPSHAGRNCADVKVWLAMSRNCRWWLLC
jgi:MFS family permease